MDSFKIILVCLAGGLLIACSQPIPFAPADTIVVPVPKVYKCDFEATAAGQYNSLPTESRMMIDDYGLERAKIAAAGKITLACEK